MEELGNKQTNKHTHSLTDWRFYRVISIHDCFCVNLDFKIYLPKTSRVYLQNSYTVISCDKNTISLSKSPKLIKTRLTFISCLWHRISPICIWPGPGFNYFIISSGPPFFFQSIMLPMYNLKAESWLKHFQKKISASLFIKREVICIALADKPHLIPP